MRLYIAGKYEEKQVVKNYMDAALALGHEITYDWTELSEGFTKKDAIRDVIGVRTADALVIIALNKLAYKGTYVELGIALARHLPIYILGSGLDACVFSLLCKKITSLDELPND